MTTELAWATGIFEGEGCLYEVKVNEYTYLGLAIEMRDQDIIERFAAALETAGVRHRSKVTTRHRGNPNHSRLYALKISGKSAEHAYQLMRPALGERRRATGDTIIAATYREPEARICEACGHIFIVPPLSRTKRYCDKKCWLSVYSKRPDYRARANERSRRYKAKQRIPAIGRGVAGAITHTRPGDSLR